MSRTPINESELQEFRTMISELRSDGVLWADLGEAAGFRGRNRHNRAISIHRIWRGTGRPSKERLTDLRQFWKEHRQRRSLSVDLEALSERAQTAAENWLKIATAAEDLLEASRRIQ